MPHYFRRRFCAAYLDAFVVAMMAPVAFPVANFMVHGSFFPEHKHSMICTVALRPQTKNFCTRVGAHWQRKCTEQTTNDAMQEDPAVYVNGKHATASNTVICMSAVRAH